MGVTDIPAPKEKTGPFITVDHLVSGIVDDKCRFGVANGDFYAPPGLTASGESSQSTVILAQLIDRNASE